MAVDAAAAGADSKRLAGHLRLRKTEARPKRTLFGSVLERLPDAELRALPDLTEASAGAGAADFAEDVAWKPIAMRRERPRPEPLPVELANFLRQRHAPDIQRHSLELDEHRRRLKLREKRINLMERDAKYVFDLPHPVDSLPTGRNYGARPRWMTAGDLDHSAEVNPNFLAPGVRNFNRDKYRSLPDSHSYALVGDPLRRGMEFDAADLTAPPMPAYTRPDRLVLTPRTNQRQQTMRRLPPSSQLVNGVDIPMRLLHQFGSDVCHSLLSNRDDVLETSRKMQKKTQPGVGSSKQLQQTEAAAVPTSQLETGDPTYEQLGNALRTNVFGRGYSVNQRVSSNHLDFTRSQFDHREPIPDEYRYKKDHVSRWAEANVLEMRMKKALQDRMDRMLHKKAED